MWMPCSPGGKPFTSRAILTPASLGETFAVPTSLPSASLRGTVTGLVAAYTVVPTSPAKARARVLLIINNLHMDILTRGQAEISPAPRVSDTRRGVPRNCEHFAVTLLNPDCIVIVEMNDGAKRNAAVEPVLHEGVTGVAGQTRLKPRIASHTLRRGEREVFHYPKRFSVFAESGVQKTVSSAVLIGIREGKLIAEWVLLQETEGVPDAYVVIRPGDQSGTIEIGPEHDKQVIACS